MAGKKRIATHLGGYSFDQRMKLVAVRVVLVIIALVGIMHVIRLVPVMFVLVALVLIMVMCCAGHCNLLFVDSVDCSKPTLCKV